MAIPAFYLRHSRWWFIILRTHPSFPTQKTRMTNDNVSKNRLMMLMFSFSIAFLLHLLLFAIAPMATILMEEMEVSYAQFGFAFSVAMGGIVVFRIPWGLLADRIGYLRVLNIALPLCVAFAFARSFSTGYVSLVLSQFFIGMGLAAVMPCLSLIVKEWLNKMPGFATGLYVAGFAAGNATVLALTPHLLEVFNWRQVFMIYAAVGAILCLLWFRFARSETTSSSTTPIKEFIGTMRDRYVWVLLILLIAAMGSYDTLATWMPKMLEARSLSPALASLLAAGFFVAGPTVGFIMDKLQDVRKIIAALGLMAGGAITAINYAPLPAMLACLFLAGFATIGVLTITLAVPVGHKRLSSSAGAVVVFISAAGNIGPLLMPILFGYLVDVTGAFQISLFCVAAIAGVTFILGSRARG